MVRRELMKIKKKITKLIAIEKGQEEMIRKCRMNRKRKSATRKLIRGLPKKININMNTNPEKIPY